MYGHLLMGWHFSAFLMNQHPPQALNICIHRYMLSHSKSPIHLRPTGNSFVSPLGYGRMGFNIECDRLDWEMKPGVFELILRPRGVLTPGLSQHLMDCRGKNDKNDKTKKVQKFLKSTRQKWNCRSSNFKIKYDCRSSNLIQNTQRFCARFFLFGARFYCEIKFIIPRDKKSLQL